jgi:hypothetical protein
LSTSPDQSAPPSSASRFALGNGCEFGEQALVVAVSWVTAGGRLGLPAVGSFEHRDDEGSEQDQARHATALKNV